MDERDHSGEWKQFILDRFRRGLVPEKEFTEELLALMPLDGPEYFRYGLELMTIIAATGFFKDTYHNV